MTGWLRCSDSHCPIRRVRMSSGPPAAVGTIIRTGCDGNVCPRAIPDTVGIAAAPAARRRNRRRGNVTAFTPQSGYRVCLPSKDAAANRLRPFHQAAEEIMSPLMIAEEGRAMPEIRGVAHFSIPVSDVDRSTKFYTEIVGCKFLSQRLARQGRRSLLRGRPARRHDRRAACVLSQSRRHGFEVHQSHGLRRR